MRSVKINLVVAQTLDELKYILEKVEKKNIHCLPLNLETQIYCSLKKIKYIKLVDLIDNSLHKKGIIGGEKLVSKLNYGDLQYECQKVSYRSLIRFKFNSIFFLNEILKILKKKFIIEKIFLSGWNKYDKQYSFNNYFLSYVFKELFQEYNLKFISKIQYKNLSAKTFTYQTKLDLNNKKKYILLNNL